MPSELSLLRVLKCFSTQDIRGFTELADMLNMDTDLTGYYLRKLQSKQLIENPARGKYQITALGKSALVHGKQMSGLTFLPRVIAMVVCKSGDQYVVIKRSKQPFLNKLEWPVNAVELGEPSDGAVQRLLKNRLGVTAQAKYCGIFRRIDTYKDEVFDDKLFAVFTTELDTKPNASSDVGEIILDTSENLAQNPNQSKSLIDILDFCNSKQAYLEKTYSLEQTDLF